MKFSYITILLSLIIITLEEQKNTTKWENENSFVTKLSQKAAYKNKIWYSEELPNEVEFSIIIYSLNYDNHKIPLRSAQKQDFKSFEIILLVDEKIKSEKPMKKKRKTNLMLLREEQEKDKRIKLEFINNQESEVLTLMKKIKLAKGKYILFLNKEHAFIRTDALSQIYNFIKENNADVIHYQTLRGLPQKLYFHKDVVAKENVEKLIVNKPDLYEYFSKSFETQSIWDKTYKKTLFENEQFSNLFEKIKKEATDFKVEDSLLNMGIALGAEKYAYLKKPLIWFTKEDDYLPFPFLLDYIDALFNAAKISLQLDPKSEGVKYMFTYDVRKLSDIYISKKIENNERIIYLIQVEKYLEFCKVHENTPFLDMTTAEELKYICHHCYEKYGD